MKKLINNIKNSFNNSPDLNIKEIQTITGVVYIIFLESICDSDKINEYILKNVTKYNIKNNLNSNLPSPKTKEINKEEINYYLLNGFAVVIKNKTILGIEVKGPLNRSISTASREPTLNGPNDAFNENYQSNLGLIKRRIKSNNLITKEFDIGTKTKTKISINYLKDIANNDLINNIEKRINKINTDGLLDAGELINLIEKENKSIFPTVKRTERPDLTANSLLEGKVIILVDTSPFVLIIPTFLVDYINPVADNYVKSNNVTFVKILRFVCFFVSMIAPAFFISIINYNQETIPTSLLLNFSMQRSAVPFPSLVELLIMLLVCDTLRESDLRFPSSFGSAISILGALIIGDAAVSAGIVSPIMIIVTALTFISSLIFTELEITNALRTYRYIFLFFAATLGLYGLCLAIILFFINVISIKTFDYPYFAPIAPFNKNYLFKTLFKSKKNVPFESNLITRKK